jgi:pyridoxine/pyridoxamine 5'-phosphate oxidase
MLEEIIEISLEIIGEELHLLEERSSSEAMPEPGSGTGGFALTLDACWLWRARDERIHEFLSMLASREDLSSLFSLFSFELVSLPGLAYAR